jgi:hypothetical protein
MAIKKRLDKRRGAVGDGEAAWLRGDYHCGFVEFKMEEESSRTVGPSRQPRSNVLESWDAPAGAASRRLFNTSIA